MGERTAFTIPPIDIKFDDCSPLRMTVPERTSGGSGTYLRGGFLDLASTLEDVRAVVGDGHVTDVVDEHLVHGPRRGLLTMFATAWTASATVLWERDESWRSVSRCVRREDVGGSRRGPAVRSRDIAREVERALALAARATATTASSRPSTSNPANQPTDGLGRGSRAHRWTATAACPLWNARPSTRSCNAMFYTSPSECGDSRSSHDVRRARGVRPVRTLEHRHRLPHRQAWSGPVIVPS